MYRKCDGCRGVSRRLQYVFCAVVVLVVMYSMGRIVDGLRDSAIHRRFDQIEAKIKVEVDPFEGWSEKTKMIRVD